SGDGLYHSFMFPHAPLVVSQRGIFMQKSLAQLQSTSPKRPVRRSGNAQRFIPVLAVLMLLGMWQLIAALKIYPTFIIPPPGAVAARFYEVLLDGTLWAHTQVTLSDRKSTRLNSSHVKISYAVFCLKKKM